MCRDSRVRIYSVTERRQKRDFELGVTENDVIDSWMNMHTLL